MYIKARYRCEQRGEDDCLDIDNQCDFPPGRTDWPSMRFAFPKAIDRVPRVPAESTLAITSASTSWGRDYQSEQFHQMQRLFTVGSKKHHSIPSLAHRASIVQ